MQRTDGAGHGNIAARIDSGSDLLSEEASRLLGGELKAPQPLVFRVFGIVRYPERFG